MQQSSLSFPVFRAASHEDPPIIIDDTGSLCVETANAILDPQVLIGSLTNSVTVASYDQKGMFNAMAFGPITQIHIVLGIDGSELGTVCCLIQPRLEMQCGGFKEIKGGSMGRKKFIMEEYKGKRGFKIRGLSVRMANNSNDVPVPIPVNALQTQMVLNLFTIHAH